MCTVTYIPISEKSYLLTSNRDESPERGKTTILPQQLIRENTNILSPIDEKANGTWLLTTETGTTLCILNGAFEKHHHSPPYAYSRGLIPFKYLSYTNPDKFCNEVNLYRVEPFTFIMCDTTFLKTLVWDGSKKHIQNLDITKNHIWSSSTLYDNKTKEFKEELFKKFSSKNMINETNILNFHSLGIDNPKEPCIYIKRDKVETVSTSIVHVNKKETTLFHQDYLKSQINKLHLVNIVN